MKRKFFVFMLLGIFFTQSCKKEEVIPITITANDFIGSIDENPANGAVIGNVQASTSQGTLSFVIVSQNLAGAVNIGSSGELTVANTAIFDFETNRQITGVITLANGDVTEQINFTININNVVEIAANDFTISVDENLAKGAEIGTIMPTSSQGASTFSIVSQDPAGALEINSSSGVLTVADSAVFDFETNPKITGMIQIVNGGETNQINFTINLKDVVEVTASDFTGNIDENPTNGAAIGTISASTDQGSLSYSIVSQTPSGVVTINSTNGALTVANAAAFDFETNTKVTGVVKVANGDASKQVNFTIDINNVIEVTASNFTGNIDENSPNGTAIGTISANTDQGSLSYSIVSQAPTGAVAINSTSGALTVADVAVFDFETNTKVTGTVNVVNGSVTKQVSFTVNINDVNESPAATKYSSVELAVPLGSGTAKNFFVLTNGNIYSTNEAGGNNSIAAQIDFGYYYGGTDNASLASPSNYPVTFLDLSGWGTQNSTTIFKTTLTTAQFDALVTNADLQTAFNAQTNPGSTSVTGLSMGDVVAFRTSSSNKIGFAKVLMVNGTFNFGDSITLQIIFESE